MLGADRTFVSKPLGVAISVAHWVAFSSGCEPWIGFYSSSTLIDLQTSSCLFCLAGC